MVNQLLTLKNFGKLSKLLSGKGDQTGGISDVEVQHLSWLGAQVPKGGNIVDVGSHKGKSICCMGSGALEAGNTGVHLFAVDLWETGKTNYAHQRDPDAFKLFLQQTTEIGVIKNIRICKTSSVGAASKRHNPVHLLFIDANHTFKAVSEDYEIWHKFVPEGCHIAFHDYKTRFLGVQKLIDEIVAPSGLWGDIRVYGSIWSATRL